ncbi:MAG: acyltransferase [Sphingomonadaceae bacterium]|nr:acyltransferase [Sphingomonadaceae bacterium]
MLRRVFAGPSVAARMVEYKNRSSGFDYLRLALSLAVMLWHSLYVVEGETANASWVRHLVILILPMFFGLSGFLVSGSLFRVRTLREFLILRAVRIVPALAVEVTLSACLIGSLLTTLPLERYLGEAQFRSYFLNILGDIHFLLPGVFKANPVPVVNMSLWTIPFELECYLALALAWIVGLIRRPWALIGVIVALQLWYLSKGSIQYGVKLPGRVLVIAFLCGVALFLYRDRVVHSTRLFALATAVALAVAWSPQTSSLVALPAAYMVVFLGLTNPPRLPLVMEGDYSYGIYLYAYPIQQAVVALFPHERMWWFNFAASIVPVSLFAAFSWHAIEKPVLGHRRRVIAVGDRIAAAVAGLRARVLTPRPAG